MPDEKTEGAPNPVAAPGQLTDPKEKSEWAIPEQYKTKVPGPIPPIPPLEGAQPPASPEGSQITQQPASESQTPVQEKKGNIFSNLISKILRKS